MLQSNQNQAQDQQVAYDHLDNQDPVENGQPQTSNESDQANYY